MNVRSILQDCGLQDYIELLKSRDGGPGNPNRRKAADWAPPTAFPGELLQQWLSSQGTRHVKRDVPPDKLSVKLPIEIIEQIFANLGTAELYHFAYFNSPLSSMALARLYHDISLDVSLGLPRVVRCLETLSNRPQLSSQVTTFEITLRLKDGDDSASLGRLLKQVLIAVYPHAYAVSVRGGSVTPDYLLFPKTCVRLQYLRLESSGGPTLNNPDFGFSASLLVHLETNMSIANTLLPHLLQLQSLVVVIFDAMEYPNETQMLYHIQHPKLRKLSVVLTWNSSVNPMWVQYLVENAAKLAQLPSVDHLTFVVEVPLWGALCNFLLKFFLPKIPSVKAILIDSSQIRPLDMPELSYRCPLLVNVVLQKDSKEWIKDQSLNKWRLFDQMALAHTLYRSQTMKSLDELQEAFRGCIKQTIDAGGRVDGNKY